MKHAATKLCALLIFLFSGAYTSLNAQTQEIPEQLQQRLELHEANTASDYFSRSDLRAKASTDVGIEDISELAKDIFFETKNLWGTNISMFSDQLSTTNQVYSWWDYASEPRKELSYETDRAPFEVPFEEFTIYQLASLKGIQLLEDSSMTVTLDGADVTEAMRANLYFLKGLSVGYLSMMYDQALLADPSVDYNLEYFEEATDQGANLQSYELVMAEAVDNLETAIAIAEGMADSDYTWSLIDSPNDINRANFIKMVHSVIAKVMISNPRTFDELQNVDAAKIITHAESGLDDSFMNIIFNTEGSYIFYDNYNDWSNFLIGSAGYLPVDMKIPYLLSNSDYPSFYPLDSGVILDPASSDDPRMDTYYTYTTNFGFSTPTRDRSLFSNYYNQRMFGNNNWGRDGLPFIFMTKSELQYIKAEAQFLAGNTTEMNAALQNSPYGTQATTLEIDLPSVQDGFLNENGLALEGPEISNDLETLQHILHVEYAVELEGISTIGTSWFMMRRHDMLQRGTPLHYPIPIFLQEYLGMDFYTFGGAENYGDPGTATGDNVWYDVPAAPIGFTGTIKNESITLEWTQEPDTEVKGYKLYEGNLDPVLIDTLPISTTIYELTGLQNNESYTYALAAITDTSESNTSFAVNLVPNFFGAPANVSMNQNDDVVQGRESKAEIPLTNFTSESVSVSDVTFEVAYEDTNLYEDFLSYYTVDQSTFDIASGATHMLEVTFAPELWGGYPTTNLKLSYSGSEEFQVTLNGGYSYVSEYENEEEMSSQAYFFDSPDSVAFGQMAEGEEKTIPFTITNTNFSAIYIDTLYTNYWDPDSMQYYPDSVFTVLSPSPNDTVRIKPFETLKVEIMASPKNEDPYEAYIWTNAGYDTFFGTPRLNKLTVNKGDFVTTNNEDEQLGTVREFRLDHNYPNPFNPTTKIQFNIPNSGLVNLTVYNILGQKVATLVNEKMSVGQHLVNFDASAFSSGIYIYRLEHGGQTQIKKMTLIK